jgi:trans-aconitate methyltransferase
MDSRAFYDDFVERQLKTGVNDRHRAIVRWLKRFGLTRGQAVLEVGCGVGTVTGLLLRELGEDGHLLAVDLSPRSIEAARVRLGNPPSLELRVADILSAEINEAFDLIVLPDVIEHIPRERHPWLFSRLRSWLAPDGLVFLHYPNPFYSSWCARHRPELLQHIDEPIHAHALAADAYANDLYLDFLETYSIWIREGDYVAAVLRPVAEGGAFTEREEETSLGKRLVRLIRALSS